MKTPLLYGSVLALIGAIVLFGLFFAGLHDSPDKLATAQWIDGATGIVATVACLALAMRDRRAQSSPEREWGYGSAFGTGAMTGLCAAVVCAILAYVYYGIINPQFSDTVYQAQLLKLQQRGLNETQIEAASGMMRRFVGPVALTVFRALGTFVWSAIIALFVAIFFRKRTTPEVVTEVPPAIPPAA